MAINPIQTPCQTIAPIRRYWPAPKYWETNVPTYSAHAERETDQSPPQQRSGETGGQGILATTTSGTFGQRTSATSRTGWTGPAAWPSATRPARHSAGATRMPLATQDPNPSRCSPPRSSLPSEGLTESIESVRDPSPPTFRITASPSDPSDLSDLSDPSDLSDRSWGAVRDAQQIGPSGRNPSLPRSPWRPGGP